MDTAIIKNMSYAPPQSSSSFPDSPSFSTRHNPFDSLKDDGDGDLMAVINHSNEGSSCDKNEDGKNWNTIVTSAETAELLSEGLLVHMLPPLEQTKRNIDDLIEKQQIVLETFQTENQR